MLFCTSASVLQSLRAHPSWLTPAKQPETYCCILTINMPLPEIKLQQSYDTTHLHTSFMSTHNHIDIRCGGREWSVQTKGTTSIPSPPWMWKYLCMLCMYCCNQPQLRPAFPARISQHPRSWATLSLECLCIWLHGDGGWRGRHKRKEPNREIWAFYTEATWVTGSHAQVFWMGSPMCKPAEGKSSLSAIHLNFPHISSYSTFHYAGNYMQ